MKTTTRFFATFYSPGTLFAEERTVEIPEATPRAAMAVAATVVERYGAKPYGFRLRTELHHEPIDVPEQGQFRVEPKLLEETPMFCINGRVIRYDDVPESEHILRSNMRGNREPLVVETRNSWKHTGFFGASDCIINSDGDVTLRGDDPELAAYRATKISEWNAGT